MRSDLGEIIRNGHEHKRVLVRLGKIRAEMTYKPNRQVLPEKPVSGKNVFDKQELQRRTNDRIFKVAIGGYPGRSE